MNFVQKKLFNITVVLFIFLSINYIYAISCDHNEFEPDFYVYGLCFSPFMDGQGPGDIISIEQIQERLAIIAQKYHTDWIRTYGAINGLEDIPAEANSLGLKVAMGTWVRHGSDPNEIINLIEACQNGVVNIAVIGNEELMAYDNGGDPCVLTPTEYFDLLADIRQQLDDVNCSHIPIAAAEPFEALFEIDGTGISSMKYTELLDKIDVLFLNIYPFWDGVYIDVAVDDLALRYQLALNEIAAREPNVTVMLGETGWASNGLTQVDAEPSVDNLAKYFHELSKWATDNNIPLFYFEAFDEKWKGALPTDIEANWGIWGSDGYLKHSFISEPVLCETFDPNTNAFCARRDWWVSTAPDPNIQPAEPNSDGQFLRLLYDATGQTWYSSVTFDRIAIGAFPRMLAKFDFRLDGPDASGDADGFSFMLIPTSLNGIEGCTEYNPTGLVFEQPKLPKTFAVGFDVWDGDGPDDLICISWDERWFPIDNSRIEAPFNLNDGNWHRARIDIRSFDTDKALVTLELAPNIYSPDPCDPIVVVENLLIDDPNHSYVPYENRVEFAGRNGGLDINVDIDNILVQWKPGICDSLDGDANDDCKVDLFDLTVIANDWLIDCNLDSDNPSCTNTK